MTQEQDLSQACTIGKKRRKHGRRERAKRRARVNRANQWTDNLATAIVQAAEGRSDDLMDDRRVCVYLPNQMELPGKPLWLTQYNQQDRHKWTLAVVDRHRKAHGVKVAVARCLPMVSTPTPPPQPAQPMPQPQLTHDLTTIMMAVGRGRADARMQRSNAHQQRQPASGLFSQPPTGRGGIIPANWATRPNIVGRVAVAAAAQAAAATQPEPNEFENIATRTPNKHTHPCARTSGSREAVLCHRAEAAAEHRPSTEKKMENESKTLNYR
jgi:hypothetical protein